jgi:hypothetical protein
MILPLDIKLVPVRFQSDPLPRLQALSEPYTFVATRRVSSRAATAPEQITYEATEDH